jgi:chromosome segregation ATPase
MGAINIDHWHGYTLQKEKFEAALQSSAAEVARLTQVEMLLRKSKRRLETLCDEADETEQRLRDELNSMRVRCDTMLAQQPQHTAVG